MNCTCPASTTLGHFRDDYYRCVGRRAGALFELTDALLTAGPLPSPVHLSSEPVHRRGWGSFYAVLRHGAIGAPALGTLLAGHPLVGGQPIYAVDCSVWPRCDAEASPERGYSYHPSRHSAGQPIVAGGPTSGLLSSASRTIVGLLSSTCVGCIRPRMPMPLLSTRSLA